MSNSRQEFIDQLLFIGTKMADLTSNARFDIIVLNSEWTIGDVLAHLIITQQILTSLLSGKKNAYIKNTDTFIEEVRQKLSRDFISEVSKSFLLKYPQKKKINFGERIN